MTEDWLKTHVLEALHSGPDGCRRLVPDLAVARPDLPARALVQALAAAAADLDASIRRGGSSTDEARTARRLALLVAMDVERMGAGADATLARLPSRWTRGAA